MSDGVRIGSGKNGEVWPCPNCEKHGSVRWLPGDEYRYRCDDCQIEFGERSDDGR